MAETKKTDTKKTETKAPAKSVAKTETKAAAKTTIRIQYFRSKIQAPVKHKLVIKGLGFTRLNQIVVREDTPSIRGMVKTVPHLVRIVG
jgi:large subunit ribosomal protein L30